MDKLENVIEDCYKSLVKFAKAMSHPIIVSDEQMEHIRKLVEQDKLPEAQRIILDELKKQNG